MKYIDKSKNEIQGNQVTSEYLIDICETDDYGNKIYPIDYENTFKGPTLANKKVSYYEKMTEELVRNQDGYCCYCMRRITGKKDDCKRRDTTLEHIIPQSEKDESYYRPCKWLDVTKVKLTSMFVKESNPIHPPFPHTVSYYNLVASCLGDFVVEKKNYQNQERETKETESCNNFRGDEKAFPIYLDPQMVADVIYMPNGYVISKPKSSYSSEIEELIEHSHLLCPSLIDIRQMWYLMRNLTSYQVSLMQGDESKRNQQISLTLARSKEIDSRRRDELIKKFLKKNFGEMLMKYDWFHTYKWK